MPNFEEFTDQFDGMLQRADRRLNDLLRNLDELAKSKEASKTKLAALDLPGLVSKIAIFKELFAALRKSYEGYKADSIRKLESETESKKVVSPELLKELEQGQDPLLRKLEETRRALNGILGEKAMPINVKAENKRTDEEHTLLVILKSALMKDDLKVTADMKMAQEGRFKRSTPVVQVVESLVERKIAASGRLGADVAYVRKEEVKREATSDPRRSPEKIAEFEKGMSREGQYLAVFLNQLQIYCGRAPDDKLAAGLYSKCIAVAEDFNRTLASFNAEKEDKKSGFEQAPIQSFLTKLNKGLVSDLKALVDTAVAVPVTQKTPGLFGGTKDNRMFVFTVAEPVKDKNKALENKGEAKLESIDVERFKSTVPKPGKRSGG